MTAISENGTATVGGVATDVSADTVSLSIDWKDGSPVEKVTPAADGRFSRSHNYLDDNPTGTPSDVYGAVVIARDEDGGATPVTANVTVNNVNPTSTLGKVLSSGMEVKPGVPTIAGLPLSAEGTGTDVGTKDVLTAQFEWDDGTPVVVLPWAPQLLDNHTYARAGRFNLGLRVLDDDGGSTVVSRVLEVLSPAAGAQRASGDVGAVKTWSANASSRMSQARTYLSGPGGMSEKLNAGRISEAVQRLEEPRSPCSMVLVPRTVRSAPP